MKKAIIFASNMYKGELKVKELGYNPSECIIISANYSHDKQKEMIRGYWKHVLIDKTVKLYGISEEGFRNLYM